MTATGGRLRATWSEALRYAEQVLRRLSGAGIPAPLIYLPDYFDRTDDGDLPQS